MSHLAEKSNTSSLRNTAEKFMWVIGRTNCVLGSVVARCHSLRAVCCCRAGDCSSAGGIDRFPFV